jgi:hypothetical protein
VLKNKLWFFSSFRNWANNNYIANAFNADGSRAKDTYHLYDSTDRVTWQLSAKNKVSVLYDLSHKNQASRGFGPGYQLDAAYVSKTPTPPTGDTVVKWTTTMSNKMLVEVGYSQNIFRLTGTYEPGVVLQSQTSACYFQGLGCGTIAQHDLVLGTFTAAYAGGETYNHAFTSNVNASVSYVTGSHSFKIGEQFTKGLAAAGTVDQNGDLVQQYANGVPVSVLVYNTPTNAQTNLAYNWVLYAQDSWTTGRLTFNPGLRFNDQRDAFPEQTAAAGRFVTARDFAAISGVAHWVNVNPRVGAVYDLFGNGKTAIKVSEGSYPTFDHTSTAAQFNPMTAVGGTGSAVTDLRTWKDLNGDGIAENNEIGPSTNSAFGQVASVHVDPHLKQPYSWITNIGVQQQLKPGTALSVTYVRRDYRRLVWQTNLDAPFSNFNLITIPDPRGNGQTIPVYSLMPQYFGQVNEYDTNSTTNKRSYNGVDISLTSRFGNGGTVIVSTSTGHTVTNYCQVEDPNNLRFCNQTQIHIPYLTGFRILGNYPLPYGFRVSGVFQSTPGGAAGIPDLPTNYVVTRVIVPTLTQASVTVRLNQPGTQLYPQINQLDFGVSRDIKTGRLSWQPKVEVANALNINPVLTQVTSFGPALGTPQTILAPRLVRLYITVKF